MEKCQCWSTLRVHILGPLLFLIYINDLTEDLSSNEKIFVDDMSLFSVGYDIQTSANNLNQDLEKISTWVTQWKMNFNPYTTKRAQEFILVASLKRCILHYCLILSILLRYLPKNS